MSKPQSQWQLYIPERKLKRETKEFLRSVLVPQLYFMAKNKWAVKNKFEEVMNHICDLGDTDLIKYSQVMAKNATYMSHFTTDELTKLKNDKMEVKLSRDLLSFYDFSILTDESSDEAGRARLAAFVCYIDPSTNEHKE